MLTRLQKRLKTNRDSIEREFIESNLALRMIENESRAVRSDIRDMLHRHKDLTYMTLRDMENAGLLTQTKDAKNDKSTVISVDFGGEVDGYNMKTFKTKNGSYLLHASNQSSPSSCQTAKMNTKILSSTAKSIWIATRQQDIRDNDTALKHYNVDPAHHTPVREVVPARHMTRTTHNNQSTSPSRAQWTSEIVSCPVLCPYDGCASSFTTTSGCLFHILDRHPPQDSENVPVDVLNKLFTMLG